jgi:hypothetical protein
MNWLEIVRTLWPIAVVLTPLICGIGFLWLKTQFPTKADLTATENRIVADIDAHKVRLDEGSRKMAEFDKRIALVEDDCKATPSRGDLNQGMSVLAGRMSGVESSVRGLEKMIGTANSYLHTLIQHGIDHGGSK